MNKDILAMWVEALRSGRYRQGKFGLRDLEDRFDPIGVLCDLAISDGVKVGCKKYEKPDAQVFFGYCYDGTATRLPKAVSEWSGLSYWSANRILTINDKGKDFGLIANYLEEKYG